MNTICAKQIKDLGISSIVCLGAILEVIKDKCTSEEFDLIKKGVGLSMGMIRMEILENIYSRFPELDDLK